jgi:hypothetical protein
VGLSKNKVTSRSAFTTHFTKLFDKLLIASYIKPIG